MAEGVLNSPGFIVAIPARFASTRLPGKPLRLIAGKPMIARVAERAIAAGAADVVVATDDVRIEHALASLPIRVFRSRADHHSGSDRLAECVTALGFADDTIVVNLQGDEPLAPPDAIRSLAGVLAACGTTMATLASPFRDATELFDPNVVKVVCDAVGDALYFSRAPLPWVRGAFAAGERRGRLPCGVPFLRHIGLYAYTVEALRRFSVLPRTALESAESLEQLRALEHGWKIRVAMTPAEFPAGVDTEDDLARVEAVIRAGGRGRSGSE